MRLIQQVTKTPLIGSGKISRCVDIKKKSKRRNIDAAKLQKRIELKKEIKLKKINFKNNKVKMIFLHWNRKGKPFTAHRLKQGIMVSLGINSSYRASRRHSTKVIIDAINSCHDMFHSDWFKFSMKSAGIQHLHLCDFFKFRKAKIIEIKKRNKPLANAGVKGWFEECLKGEEYLKEKYSYYAKDEYPHLTKRLTEIWEKYEGQKVKSPKEINLITGCCKRAVQFSDLNKKIDSIHPQEILDTIDRMINQFKDFKPKHLGWLTNNIFWSEQLPKELVRWGTVYKDDKNKIQLLDRE